MEKTQLGNVATYINGYAFKPSDWSSKGVPIIRIQNLTGSSSEENRFEGIIPKKYEVNKGDILISWSASLGIYVWNREKAYLNQHIFKVVFDKCKIDKSFFIHQTKSILDKASNSVHGATMKHLTKPVFDSLPFYLPELTKQKEIGNILNKIQNIISLYQKKLEQLDLLIKARFVEMFGDPSRNTKNFPIKKLSDIAIYYSGLVYKPTDVNETGTLVLRSGNIQKGQLSFEDNVRVNLQINAKFFVKNNDILMCNRNGSAKLVGKVAKIQNINEKMAFGAFMSIIRSNFFNYLYVYFQLPTFRQQLSVGSTSTINQITVKMFDDIKLPVPTNKEIKEFDQFMEQIDKSKFI